MAKDSIRTYSSTAASNTDVGGVGIQGTDPASNMDDGLREIMSHLAETNAGTAPVDDTWSFCDPADATKKFRFDGGGITAGSTRVMTIPDADMTLGNIPGTNDGAALGSATKSWSDLFLASGGVINFANGNYTITHASGTVSLSGTLDLGHATDTTIARAAAGFISVEGNRVPSPASQAAGDILYRGTTEWERLAKGTARQHLRMNSGATAPEWSSEGLLNAGTAQATTSGTTKDFTSIPSWVQKISVNFSGLSTSGSSVPLIQIGDSGGIEATGYLGSGGATSSSGNTAANYTTGFGLGDNHGAAFVVHGRVTLELLDAATNTWTASGVLGRSDNGWMVFCTGSKSLSATLDRVRITTVNGTDTFDAGSVNIMYE